MENTKAYELTEQNLDEFKIAFSLFDIAGDDTIPTKELGTVMRSLGHKPTEVELEDIIKKVDAEGKGKIHFPEFLKIMIDRMEEHETLEEIREAFRVFDSENKGFITKSNIKQIMSSFGEDLADEEVDEMIRESGIDAVDGRINFEGFFDLMRFN